MNKTHIQVKFHATASAIRRTTTLQPALTQCCKIEKKSEPRQMLNASVNAMRYERKKRAQPPHHWLRAAAATMNERRIAAIPSTPARTSTVDARMPKRRFAKDAGVGVEE